MGEQSRAAIDDACAQLGWPKEQAFQCLQQICGAQMLQAGHYAALAEHASKTFESQERQSRELKRLQAEGDEEHAEAIEVALQASNQLLGRIRAELDVMKRTIEYEDYDDLAAFTEVLGDRLTEVANSCLAAWFPVFTSANHARAIGAEDFTKDS